MSFSSIGFLFRFLPIFLIVYYVFPAKYRNLILLSGSLLFYGVGEPRYVGGLIITVAVNYGIHFWMQYEPKGPRKNRKRSNKRRNCLALAVALVWNISLLATFKYWNVIADLVADAVLKQYSSLSVPEMTLPLGISFITFQFLAFHIDCFRGQIKKKVDFISFSTYICMFPKLTSGPITRYAEIEEELQIAKITPQRLDRGIRYLTLGLAMKVLLADQIATLWNSIMTAGPGSLSTPVAWLGAIAYSFEIYFDFLGYSMIAVGIADMLGFSLPHNFDNPYYATSFSEFWRRWHITLGRFFRDYIYIPLGGNRRGFIRTLFNLLVVWLLTGIWHGAEFNFILWGLFFFVLIALEKFLYGDLLKKNSVVGHLYVMLLIPVSWILFGISDYSQLTAYLGDLAGIHIGASYVGTQQFFRYLGEYGLLLFVCTLFSTPLPFRLVEKWKNKWFVILMLFVSFWLSVQKILISIDNPFMYFNY